MQDVFVVTRTSSNKYYPMGHKAIVGACSSVEKAWKMIERDFRLVPRKDEMAGCFTNTSPWGVIYDGVRFVTTNKYADDGRVIYHIERLPIDLYC